jgi:hypothetical protein
MRRVSARVFGLLAAGVGALGLAVPSAEAGIVVTQPTVAVNARCRIESPGTSTVWFGYTNAYTGRVNVVGGRNLLYVNGAPVNAAQVQQFQPGSVAYAFSMSVPTGSTLRWRVAAPRFNPANGALLPDVSISIAQYSGALPICPPLLSRHSATPRFTSTPSPSTPNVAMSIGSPQRDANGLLAANSVTFSINSPGGVPMPLRIEYGYGGNNAQSSNGQFVPDAETSLQLLGPIPANLLLRTTTMPNGGTIQWTGLAIRPIPQPQRVTNWANSPTGHSFSPTFGAMAEQVIADVFARCSFDGATVTSRTRMWVDRDGRFTPFYTVTDVPTQKTRLAIFCPTYSSLPPPAALVTGCDLPVIAVGPGGQRIR